MSGVLTVKVEGFIEPHLAQMASTKACYKLGLKVPMIGSLVSTCHYTIDLNYLNRVKTIILNYRHFPVKKWGASSG